MRNVWFSLHLIALKFITQYNANCQLLITIVSHGSFIKTVNQDLNQRATSCENRTFFLESNYMVDGNHG